MIVWEGGGGGDCLGVGMMIVWEWVDDPSCSVLYETAGWYFLVLLFM